MIQASRKNWLSYGSVASVLVLLLLGGGSYAFISNRKNAQQSANFNVRYPKPFPGWKEKRHSPEALFLYEQPQKGLLLRGSVNQMVSDINPTPDLDRDNVAKLITDNTLANMPGWTAEIKDIIKSNGTTFRLVRRTQPNYVIVTAFAVEGNTTLLISLSGRDKNSVEVDKAMPEFHDFVSKIALTKADTTNW